MSGDFFIDMMRPVSRLYKLIREATPVFIPDFKSDFESILDSSDILILGDTKHQDPKIYRFVIRKVLAAAAKKGFSYISPEIPTSYQKAFDAYYYGRATSDRFQKYMIKRRQDPHIAMRFALLVEAARKNNIKVICADSQDNLKAIHQDDSLSSLEFSIKYVTIRASYETNKAFVDRTFAAVDESEKGIFLIGNGHVEKILEALNETNKRVAAICLFGSDKDERNYLDKREAVHPVLRELLSGAYLNNAHYSITSAKLSNLKTAEL